MALRTLVCDGVEWTVWDVLRTLQGLTSLALPDTASAGWLCFQSRFEKRRLVPAPPGWERWPDERLAAALRAAPVVTPHVPHPPLAAEAAREADERQLRINATLERARALGDRVRRAMAEGRARLPEESPDEEEQPPLPSPP